METASENRSDSESGIGDGNAPDCSIIVPHYTDAERTLRLAGEIAKASSVPGNGFSIELVIIDDASPDGSGDAIESALRRTSEETCKTGLATVFRRNQRNIGFSSTVNRGACLATGKIFVFCNTDIVFANPGGLSEFVTRMTGVFDDPGIGAVMPMIFNKPLDEVENINELWANRGLLWLRRLKETCEFTNKAKAIVGRDIASGDSTAADGLVESVLCGAFFAMRGIDYHRLGGLNPIFHPYYWEDVELGVRVKLNGKRVVVDTNLAVLHEHDGSIGKSTTEKKRWNAMFENQLKFSKMYAAEFGIGDMHFWHVLRGLRSLFRGELHLAKKYLFG